MVGEDIARKVVAALRKGEGPTSEFPIVLVSHDATSAVVRMVVTPGMLNGMGNIHGGMLFTLADTAFAYACNGNNVASVAQAASISFLSPGRLGETITARAHQTALVGRSGICDVHIFGEDGRVVAIFQGLSRSLGRPLIDLNTGELIHG